MRAGSSGIILPIFRNNCQKPCSLGISFHVINPYHALYLQHRCCIQTHPACWCPSVLGPAGIPAGRTCDGIDVFGELSELAEKSCCIPIPDQGLRPVWRLAIQSLVQILRSTSIAVRFLIPITLGHYLPPVAIGDSLLIWDIVRLDALVGQSPYTAFVGKNIISHQIFNQMTLTCENQRTEFMK